MFANLFELTALRGCEERVAVSYAIALIAVNRCLGILAGWLCFDARLYDCFVCMID